VSAVLSGVLVIVVAAAAGVLGGVQRGGHGQRHRAVVRGSLRDQSGHDHALHLHSGHGAYHPEQTRLLPGQSETASHWLSEPQPRTHCCMGL
jgi:hypothetical protein